MILLYTTTDSKTESTIVVILRIDIVATKEDAICIAIRECSTRPVVAVRTLILQCAITIDVVARVSKLQSIENITHVLEFRTIFPPFTPPVQHSERQNRNHDSHYVEVRYPLDKYKDHSHS